MTLRKTLTSIVLAGALALGSIGCDQREEPNYPYKRAGQIAKIPSTDVSVGHGGIGLAAADFDGDGDIDLAVMKSYHGDVILYKNDGSGNFEK